MKYAIWNKKDNIITPVGEVLTAEQWIQRYPVAGIDDIDIVCSAGVINGGFFGVLAQMVQMYESKGCDFSSCATAEEKLQAMEDFDKAAAEAVAEAAANREASTDEVTAASLASIAASLEYQNMMSLEDAAV